MGVTMTSRVRKKLCLKKKGTEVLVRGPILSWGADELSAVFSVAITQIDKNGNVVTANGASTALYTPGSTHWTAKAFVTDPSLRLENGPATAYATAKILIEGPAYETYEWILLTRLVHCK
jgi:hypothetical protein